MNDHRRIVIIAHGIVQGVFYRDSTRKKALELGLLGTVQNLSDGTVRIVAEGTKDRLETLVQWARQGPSASKVSHVEVSSDESPVRLDGFQIIY